MANPNPNERKMTAAPNVGDRPSVRIDAALAADLADVMACGGTFADAVRQGVGLLAYLRRTAWAHGVVPVGTAPTLGEFRFAEQAPAHPVSSRYDLPSDTSDGRPTRPVAQMVTSPTPGASPLPRHPAAPAQRRTPLAPPQHARPGRGR